jgi:hypothetical protein
MHIPRACSGRYLKTHIYVLSMSWWTGLTLSKKITGLTEQEPFSSLFLHLIRVFNNDPIWDKYVKISYNIMGIDLIIKGRRQSRWRKASGACFSCVTTGHCCPAIMVVALGKYAQSSKVPTDGVTDQGRDPMIRTGQPLMHIFFKEIHFAAIQEISGSSIVSLPQSANPSKT